MKITTAWQEPENDREMPTLLSAYDEHTFDAWGGVPDFHTEATRDSADNVRELVIEVPDEAVLALWLPGQVTGTILP